MNCYFCHQPLNPKYYLSEGKYIPVCLQHPIHLMHAFDKDRLVGVYSTMTSLKPVYFSLQFFSDWKILLLLIDQNVLHHTSSALQQPVELNSIISMIDRYNKLKAFL